MTYVDRVDAGRRLAPGVAAELSAFNLVDTACVVLGIPRGGVVVARQVADHLNCDLDIALARKIGAPGNPELAIGAVGETGDPYLAKSLIRTLRVSDEFLEQATRLARDKMVQLAALYRVDRDPPVLRGSVVIVVDDGIATGATLRATLLAVRQQSPGLLVCAVPVGPPDSIRAITAEVDVMVCPLQPRRFRAVGEWYERFDQTSNAAVMAVLAGS
ncbi:MAG: phosphoribosyltransferase [bacterium]|nr:phosphoribosyltransferase [bacterium]